MDEGWISLHRKLTKWQWYSNKNVCRLFIHLLLMANHKDNSHEGIRIKKGQRLTSNRKLAGETGLTVQEVKTALKKLESTHEITRTGSNKNTLITIVNYEGYQNSNPRINPDKTSEANPQKTVTHKPQKSNPAKQEKATHKENERTKFIQSLNEEANKLLTHKIGKQQPTNPKNLTTNNNDNNKSPLTPQGEFDFLKWNGIRLRMGSSVFVSTEEKGYYSQFKIIGDACNVKFKEKFNVSR